MKVSVKGSREQKSFLFRESYIIWTFVELYAAEYLHGIFLHLVWTVNGKHHQAATLPCSLSVTLMVFIYSSFQCLCCFGEIYILRSEILSANFKHMRPQLPTQFISIREWVSYTLQLLASIYGLAIKDKTRIFSVLVPYLWLRILRLLHNQYTQT